MFWDENGDVKDMKGVSDWDNVCKLYMQHSLSLAKAYGHFGLNNEAKKLLEKDRLLIKSH